jgi:hypothetical protein
MDDPLKKLKAFFSPKQAPLDERVNAAYTNPNVTQAKPSKKNAAAQQGIPAWMDALYKSPLADSLYQISAPDYIPYRNSPVSANLGALKNPDEGLQGTYQSYNDQIELHKDQNISGKDTFKHEIGHRYASNKEKKVDGGAYKYPSFFGNDSKPGSPQYSAMLRVDAYGATSPDEAYAQAFRNAFDFLAETARDPKMDVRAFAGDLEANTPGMGMIITDLMKLPIFANHPLQGKIFREKK